MASRPFTLLVMSPSRFSQSGAALICCGAVHPLSMNAALCCCSSSAAHDRSFVRTLSQQVFINLHSATQ
eukprot:1000-Heterococcus_DN1.PRE.8